MALQKQNFAVSFLQGIETKADSKQVMPGKLLQLVNGVLTKTGKIVKRNGYDPLGNSIESGTAITTYQDELIAFNGLEAFSYSANTESFLSKGPLNAIKIDSKPVIRNTYQQTNADSTIHSSGLQVFTWTDSRGASRYSCVDSVTGQIVVSDQEIAPNATKAKPVCIGNYVLILFFDTILGTIRGLPLPVLVPNNPQPIFEVANTVDTGNPNYDACRIGDRCFVAFNSLTGGGAVKLLYLNAVLSSSSVVTFAGENADRCISVFGDAANNNVYVAYGNGAAVKAAGRDYSITIPLFAPTLVETIANVKNVTGAILNNSGTIYYTITAAQTYNNRIKQRSFDNVGMVGAASEFVRSLSIASKAFIYSGIKYLNTVFDTALQPTIFTLNEDAVAVAKIAPSLAGGTVVNNMLSNVISIDGLNFLCSYTKKDLLASVNGNIFTQTGVQSSYISFVQDNSFEEVELGYNLHVTGGLIQMYDGISFVEHNFNYYPENFTNSINTGAGNITAGTRQYIVTYEWEDNQGQIHRSTTSVPLSVTNAGATNTNTLTIPTLRLTEKRDNRNPVQIVVYRTVDAGTVFYQVSSITSPTYNDTTVDTVTFADSSADGAIIGNNFLYTNGGVVDNAQAEATNIIASFKGRIVYVPSEDPYSFNYSKQTVPGTPVEFYDQQATQVDQLGGKITAIRALDDKMILFKERAILMFGGDGPDSTGSQNDFSTPQLITTDGGCVNASSVVTMPLGLMYKSEKGIYLLDRGLNVKYIGSDVEFYNSSTILSSTLVANKNQVRFALDSGIVLVYDYFVSQWYIFNNHYLMVDTVSYNDTFVYLRSDGVVLAENSTYSDNGNYIPMKIKTSWFSLAGFQAFQRMYKALVIGEYRSKHKLRVSLAYDFNPTLVYEQTINAYDLLNNPAYGDTSPYGDEEVYGGNYPLYQFRYLLPRQKCEAIQVTIEDIQIDTIGEGYQMSALAFEVGVKKGLDKLGSTRTFS